MMSYVNPKDLSRKTTNQNHHGPINECKQLIKQAALFMYMDCLALREVSIGYEKDKLV